jgi:hypothetical protein
MAKSIIVVAKTTECVLTIGGALRLRRLLRSLGQPVPRFLCTFCKRPVRAESKGRNFAAHFEHLQRNIECPLSEKSKAKQLYAKHRANKAKTKGHKKATP